MKHTLICLSLIFSGTLAIASTPKLICERELYEFIDTKTADGKITAVYDKNADLRGDEVIEKVILDCKLEN